MNIQSDPTENAESESVRLGATRDLIDRAGFRPVDRHEIVKEKSCGGTQCSTCESCRKDMEQKC